MHAQLYAKGLVRAGLPIIDMQRYKDEMERYKYADPLSTLVNCLTSVDVPNIQITASRWTNRGGKDVNEPCIYVSVSQGIGFIDITLTVDELKAFRNQINKTILDYHAAAGQHLLHIFEEENQKMAEWL